MHFTGLSFWHVRCKVYGLGLSPYACMRGLICSGLNIWNRVWGAWNYNYVGSLQLEARQVTRMESKLMVQ